MTSRIKALDIDVVNKIAAGEIIVAPANALKELLENAIDAKSTSIDIIIQDGGLKLLQMTDNGVGIHKEDLPILCERFTTSKLSTFEDLSSIGTYGFRGEALASISHISRLTVTTKTKDSACAYRAIYQEGKMVGEPKPVAGKDGTQIVIEDLFYNVPSRLRSLKGANEQLSKILDVVARYAINTEGVAFSVKKAGDTLNLLAVRSNNSTKDKVRTVFGSAVANELLPIAVEKDEEIGLLSCHGQITNTSYYSKKSVPPIFFINGRLVSCDPLKRMIIQLYSSFLPKGHRPFVYLSIDIKRQNLDVNVHPTKREVRFLFEEEIFQAIFQAIQAKLGSLDHSRKFVTAQTVLKQQYAPQEDEPSRKPQTLLRTDSLQSKITSFINTANAESFGTIVKDRVTVKLSSILELRQELETRVSEDLTNMFAKHTYVGLVDQTRRLCCIQYDVKLYLVDYASICYELFYQIGLSDFNNFGTLYLESEQPVSIREMLKTVYDSIDKSLPSIDDILEALFEMKEMLLEYFSIELEGTERDPIVKSLPIVVKGYTPSFSKLPLFWYRLGTSVDWSSEKECLNGILRQIALLYVPESSETEGIEKTLEDLIFPTIKTRLLAVDNLSKSVVEIANLPGLYKVFERC